MWFPWAASAQTIKGVCLEASGGAGVTAGVRGTLVCGTPSILEHPSWGRGGGNFQDPRDVALTLDNLVVILGSLKARGPQGTTNQIVTHSKWVSRTSSWGPYTPRTHCNLGNVVSFLLPFL